MTKFITTIALVLLTHAVASAQLKVEVKPFEAIKAKSAQVLELQDSVAVILEEREAGVKTGAELTITSNVKWPTPWLDKVGTTLDQSKTDPSKWILFAPPGVHRVTVVEFDPERGPKFTGVDVTVLPPKDAPKPDPGNPPPTGDYAALIAVVDAEADKTNDPTTRATLAAAYKAAIVGWGSKTYTEVRAAVTTSRWAVLNAREGSSENADWDTWRLAVDKELGKVVPPGDTAKYAEAISAIVKGLEQQ